MQLMHLDTLLKAILEDDVAIARKLLRTTPSLSVECVAAARLFESEIFHWLYVGDTALHLAAAGYRVEIADLLLAAGADVNSAANHRRGRPLHYAADGFVNGPAWNADRQVAMIRRLLNGGAEIDARDKNGATALHRAVRTRCAAAVAVLLDAGSDPAARNNSGSTPFHLAVQDTGRGGSGSAEARSGQQLIIQEFISRGVSASLKDGNGRTVAACATSVGGELLRNCRQSKSI